jgi:hypothetical protein
MKWFIPSWNGDIRVEPAGENTKLTVYAPTPNEIEKLETIGQHAVVEKWINKWRKRWGKETELELSAPFETVGAYVASVLRPEDAVMTALRFRDGHVETVQGPAAVLEKKVAEAKEDAEVAATVKRPTPCCPRCIPGSVVPASEVLLSFLTPEEHSTWAEHRAIIVRGGLTGHRYILAHRHSALAHEMGRICFDLDTPSIVHFHDWSVPPEEEILAAKLILEHREPWLRNEATLNHFLVADDLERNLVFKNPFGDGQDGVMDAHMCWGVGVGFGFKDRIETSRVPENFYA